LRIQKCSDRIRVDGASVSMLKKEKNILALKKTQVDFMNTTTSTLRTVILNGTVEKKRFCFGKQL